MSLRAHRTFAAIALWLGSSAGLTAQISIWPPSSAPGAFTPSAPVTLGTKFRSDVPGAITGIRFYKAAAYTGAYTGLLYSSSGTLLGQASYTGSPSASGWQQVNFATPVSIAANTTYVAAYFTASGYAYDGGTFANSVDNPPLHALRAGVDGPNGLWSYGSGPTFPTTYCCNSNYWVDVAFQDNPPRVDSITPSGDSGWNHTFAFQFSDPDGASQIVSAFVMISDPPSSTNSCFLYIGFVPNAAYLYLEDDTGVSHAPSLTGTTDVQQNSQCYVYAAGSSVVTGTTTVTLNLALSFKPGYLGSKQMLASVWDGTLASDWISHGTFTVTAPPSPGLSVSPAPASVSVSPGGTATYTVTTSATNLGGAAIAYSASGLPPGATATFSPAAVTVAGAVFPTTQTLTITTAGNSPPGTYTPVITATGGGLTRTASASLVVIAQPPNITSLSPTSGAAGTAVTISGTNFGATQGSSTVTFNGIAAAPTSWSAGSIVAPVPAAATNGDVVVTVAGQASNHVAFTVLAPPTSFSASPSSASGHRQVFTLDWTDPVAQSNISQFQVKFTTNSGDTSNSCWVTVDRNNIYFHDDNGVQASGVPFYGGTVLQNHQCGVKAWESSLTPATDSGTTATLTLSVYFLGAYTGARTIWMSATNALSSPWAAKGAYTVADQVPSVGAFTLPASAWTQDFTFHYTDPDGAADFANVQVMFNNGFDPYYDCFLVIDASGSIYLSDDVTGAPMNPIVAGQPGGVHNKYCSVDGPGSQFAPGVNGVNDWTLRLRMGFTPFYSGPRTVSTVAADTALLTSGWANLGTYTVPAVGTTYNISGQVTSSGSGLSAVTMTLSGTQNAIVTTDSAGNYAFDGLAAGGSYALWPTQTGSTFAPGTASTGNLSGNWTVPVFAAVPPGITTASLPSGTANAPYSQTLAASGGSTPYTWSVAAGSAALPAGLTLSTGGVLSGTPSAAGTFTPTFQVRGNDGASSTRQLSVTIAPAPDFGVTISPSDRAATGGGASYVVTILPQNGFVGPATVYVSAISPSTGPQPTVHFNTTSLPIGGGWSTSMDVTAPNFGTTVGTWDVTVGVYGGIAPNQFTRTATAHFDFHYGPNFTITVTPPASPITAGLSAIYGVSVVAVNGFDPNTPVTLNISQMPTGATATPNSLSVLADGTAHAFTVATSANTPTGNFYVYGSDGSKMHGVWASLTTQTNPAGTYTISGVVQQPNGVGMGGTTLTVRDSQNSVVSSVTSDDSGNYSIPLQAGQYTITAASPYGIFSPAAKVYNLSAHLPAQHRRLMTMNMAPPDDLPFEDARNYYNIPNTGVPQTKPFWFLSSDDNARNVSSCRVSRPENEPSAYVTAQFNYPTEAEVAAHGRQYFTITFTAQPSAALGNRDITCHYNGQDIVGITGINVYSSCVPHVTAVTINGEATSTIIAGTKGKLGISGECLNNENPSNALSVTVAGGNIQIPSIDSADAYGIVASYSASSSAAGTQNLTVQTDRGTDFKALFATKLTVQAVTFPASQPSYKKDCPGSLIDILNSVPAWKASNRTTKNDCSTGSLPPNEAVIYTGGTIMTAKVDFTVDPVPTSPVSGVRVEGAVVGLGKFLATGCTIPAASSFTAGAAGCPVPSFVLQGHAENTTDPADKALPTASQFYDPMAVDWQISTDGSPCALNCAHAGSTANTVYVTLGKDGPSGPAVSPTLFPLYLTAVHLAASIDGATRKSEAFQKTWSQFAGPSGPANVRTWDGRPLYYYKVIDPPGVPVGDKCATTVEDLLRRSDGDGQCGSFALLFEWSLAMSGMQVELNSLSAHNPLAEVRWTHVETSDYAVSGTLMVIKNWMFSSPPTSGWSLNLGSPDYMVPPPAIGFGDLTNSTGISGQGSPTPCEKVFDFHFIVKVDAGLSVVGGPYFDPSYGVSYANEADFEAQAIACGTAGNCGGYAVPAGTAHPGLYHVEKSGATPRITFTPRVF